MSEIILGLTLLSFFLVWKFVWQKTLLDYTRDKLFDLRDELRQWFIDNGYNLDHQAYNELRSIINSHLRHTERATMTSYITFIYISKKYKDYNKGINVEADKIFDGASEELCKFIRKVRNDASSIILTHMIFRSAFLSFLIIIIGIVMFCWMIIKKIINKIDVFKITPQRVLATVMGVISIIPMFRNEYTTMEKYSTCPQFVEVKASHS